MSVIDKKQTYCDNAFIPQRYLESLSRICDLLGMDQTHTCHENGREITREQNLLNILSDISACQKFFNLLCSNDKILCFSNRFKNSGKQEYLFDTIEIFNKALDICLEYHGVSSLSFHNFFNIFIKNSTTHFVYQAIRHKIKPNMSNRIKTTGNGSKVYINSNSYLLAAYFGLIDVMDLLERHYPSIVDSIDSFSRGTPIVFLLQYLHRSPKVSEQTPYFAYGRRYDSIDFSKRYRNVMSQKKHFSKWINHPLNTNDSPDLSFYSVSQRLIWSSICGFNKYSLPQNKRINHYGHEIEMGTLIKNKRKELVRTLVSHGLDPIFFPMDVFELTEDNLILNLVKNHITQEFESNQSECDIINNNSNSIMIIKSNEDIDYPTG